MKKFFFKIGIFAAFFPLFYFGTLFFLSRLDYQGVPLITKVLKNGASAGADNYNLTRFRELEKVRDLDILFLGSSHAFRSFDPRIFQSQGISSFVLGSGAQSPLNTYYLLKRYEPKLKPKLIVFELYFKVFEMPHGLESFYDLVLNLPLSWELFEMALATRTFEAVNSFFAEIFMRQRQPLAERFQKSFSKYRYVEGGYVETQGTLTETIKVKDYPSGLNARQLAYLKKIIRYAQDRRIPILLVTQPLPKEYLSRVTRYSEMVARFRKIASSSGVAYYDFNEMLNLETYRDFCDAHHLNAAGVQKFNDALLKILLRDIFTRPSA